MTNTILKVLLVAAAVASAQAFVCNEYVKPGQVQNIRLTSTGFYNGYSSMTFAWDRPNDANNAGVLSCIKAYNVEIYRMDGQRIQSANVPVTLDAPGATYQAKGLSAGTQYKIAVSAEGPKEVDGAPSGQRGPYTSAPAVSSTGCDENLKPGQVSTSNIRMIQTTTDGSFSSIKWEWDRPNDKINTLNSCINAYDVAVFTESGNQFISANVPVELTHTKGYFEARGLTRGNRYFIAVTGRSPKQGTGAPGAKAGPFTAQP